MTGEALQASRRLAGKCSTAERGGTQRRYIFGDPMQETRDDRGRAWYPAGDVTTLELGESPRRRHDAVRRCSEGQGMDEQPMRSGVACECSRGRAEFLNSSVATMVRFLLFAFAAAVSQWYRNQWNN